MRLAKKGLEFRILQTLLKTCLLVSQCRQIQKEKREREDNSRKAGKQIKYNVVTGCLKLHSLAMFGKAGSMQHAVLTEYQ